MMKFFIALSFVLLGASALHEEVIKAKWAAYKAEHGKEYHPSEEASRLNNFLEATIHIENHNARFHRGEVSYELGHNHLSDLSHDEFKATRQGRLSMNVEIPDLQQDPFMVQNSLPESVNWTSICTPVKEQGLCGSCYAFGVVGVVEALYYNNTRQWVDLSEQEIIDCSYHIVGKINNGCFGGSDLTAMSYIIKKGLVNESSYEYRSGWTRTIGNCERQAVEGIGVNLRYIRVPKHEETLAHAVARYGPVFTAMHAEHEDFKYYKSGIFSDPQCRKNPTHTVVVVGYGTENGVNYWIIRNSWGTRWGEYGYGRILRGDNQCGIVTYEATAIRL